MHRIKLYTGIALAVFVIIFVIQNTAVVDIRFLFWKLSMSRSLMIFAVLLLGIVIGWLLHDHFRHNDNRTDK
ncbi:MAG: LapA family protein [Sulfurimonadaceae bacterium]|nr:LapA family protein [Sulfurimonadaceae bacterium]